MFRRSDVLSLTVTLTSIPEVTRECASGRLDGAGDLRDTMLGDSKHRARDADGRGDLASVIEHGSTDAAKPGLDLLVVHRESSPPNQLKFGPQRCATDDRSPGTPGQLDAIDQMRLLRFREVCQKYFANRRAMERRPATDRRRGPQRPWALDVRHRYHFRIVEHTNMCRFASRLN